MLKELSIVIPAWKSFELLKVSIPSLLDNSVTDFEVKVALNEADKESIEFLRDNKIEIVCLNDNWGTGAIDYCLQMCNGEFLCNTNTDMYYSYGWDKILVDLCKEYYPCSSSAFLVEPLHTNNPCAIIDDLGDFYTAREKFEENSKAGKYKHKRIVSYSHPVCCKTEDMINIGGYSHFFHPDFRAGYGLDDLTPWKMWKAFEGRFGFISSELAHVYHGMSKTNEKLSSDMRRLSGWDRFIQVTGMTIHEFRRQINIFSEIE